MPSRSQRRLQALIVVLVAVVIGVAGEARVGLLLVASQVLLSLQLPFAMVPLLRLTGDARVMGRFASPRWLQATAWSIAGAVIALNAALIWQAL